MEEKNKNVLLQMAREQLALQKWELDKHWFGYLQTKREIAQTKKTIKYIKKQIAQEKKQNGQTQ